MSNMNLLPSKRAGIVGVYNPQSVSAGTVTTGWISMVDYRSIMVIILAGALGASATVDAKLQQATDSSGTGAKDVTSKAITQLTKAGTDDNKQVIINCRADELDIDGGFTHVRLSMTVATAACLLGAVVLGMDRRHGYQDAGDLTTVDEIVA